jgi:hypothetical protein
MGDKQNEKRPDWRSKKETNLFAVVYKQKLFSS